MQLNDLINNTSEWLKGTGPDSEIVMSSRVRLARNIADLPSSHWADKEHKAQILEITKDAVSSSKFMKDCLFLNMKGLDEIDKQFLLERHLVSREFTQDGAYKAVAITANEMVSIMINEEDHLRIQVMQSGFNPTDVWRIADEIDSELESKMEYAYSAEWGYLTACPTNVGTGMRASVMMHLPMLVLTKQIDRIIQAMAKLSFTTRGLYGEGTEASGNFFQISNQVTLGHSEEELLDNLERVIKQILGHEQNARRASSIQNRAQLSDKIWRAYGTLKNAHIISSTEAISLMSLLRLGIDMGIIKDIDRKLLNELLLMTQPAHLQKIEGKALSPAERDVKRANIIREKLK